MTLAFPVTTNEVMVAAGLVSVPVRNKFVPIDPPAEKFSIVPTVKVDRLAITAVRLPAVKVPVNTDAMLPTLRLKLFAVIVALATCVKLANVLDKEDVVKFDIVTFPLLMLKGVKGYCTYVVASTD